MRLTFHNPFEQVFVADVSTHLSTYLLLTGVRVCVCVCLYSFDCKTSLTYLRWSDQRSFVVSISRGFCQVPSSLFLILPYLHIFIYTYFEIARDLFS